MNYSISVGGIFVSYFILNYVDGGTVINVSFFFFFFVVGSLCMEMYLLLI